MDIFGMLKSLWESTGFTQSTWQNYVMILVSFVLFYLAIVHKFEPLLLLPIAFGMPAQRTYCFTRGTTRRRQLTDCPKA